MANSASGIAVHDDCKLKFLELKAKRNYRYIIFKIDNGLQQVTVEKVGGAGESHLDLDNSLPADDCRYAVFDYDFTTDENCHKSKIFFIAWCNEVMVRTDLGCMGKKDRRRIKTSSIEWLEELLSRTDGYTFDVPTVDFCRSPEIAKVRTKMLYASSKDRFKRELDGIQVELQATDASEMSMDIFKERAY